MDDDTGATPDTRAYLRRRDAARRALALGGPVIVSVRCSKGCELGSVRDTQAGAVWLGYDPNVERAARAEISAVYDEGVLRDPPVERESPPVVVDTEDVDADEVLHCGCRRHGRHEVTVGNLRVATARGRRTRQVVTVTVQ